MSIMALDYGQKRIGIAISYFGELGEPLGVYPRSEFLEKIAEIVEGEKVTRIIVGLPEGKMKKQVYHFGKTLEKKLTLKPIFIDETLTSQKAQNELIIKGVKRKTRKRKEDAYAACLILEQYLEQKK